MAPDIWGRRSCYSELPLIEELLCDQRALREEGVREAVDGKPLRGETDHWRPHRR
jgi:hypothetical protein